MPYTSSASAKKLHRHAGHNARGREGEGVHNGRSHIPAPGNRGGHHGRHRKRQTQVIQAARKEYQRLSSHIGLLPLVMVSPRHGANQRRRRRPQALHRHGDSTGRPNILDQLIRYNRALQQRNTMLREATADTNLFLAVEMSMAASGAYIHKARSRQIGTAHRNIQPLLLQP